MRTTLGLALLFVFQSACTPGVGPLYVVSLKPATAGCPAPKDTDLTLTALTQVDIAAAPSLELWAKIGGGLDFFGTQTPLSVTMNSTLSRNVERIVIRSVFIKYSSKPTIPGLSATLSDTVPRTMLLSREVPEANLAIPLFGPNGLSKLAALSPSNTDKYEFTSTIEIRGVIEPGGSEIRTAPISMPMTLVKSEVTCRATPNDQRLKRFGNPPIPSCSPSIGMGRRYTENDCCATVDANGNAALDVNTPGCDVLP